MSVQGVRLPVRCQTVSVRVVGSRPGSLATGFRAGVGVARGSSRPLDLLRRVRPGLSTSLAGVLDDDVELVCLAKTRSNVRQQRLAPFFNLTRGRSRPPDEGRHRLGSRDARTRLVRGDPACVARTATRYRPRLRDPHRLRRLRVRARRASVLRSLIRDRGVIVFDEWNAGRDTRERRAFEEFMAEHTELEAYPFAAAHDEAAVFVIEPRARCQRRRSDPDRWTG
jgi:hypothetical protein